MIDYDKAVADLDQEISRRKAALGRLKAGGERPGTVGERRLRKLLKEAQRRRARLLKDRARREGKKPEQSR
jgi:hypothetical protein